jgi:hypothetical protein
MYVSASESSPITLNHTRNGHSTNVGAKIEHDPIGRDAACLQDATVGETQAGDLATSRPSSPRSLRYAP